jgi:peptidoglycan L-alanyl-D-glutamate endopeptidase CwlK
MFYLGWRSRRRLKGVHPDLVAVVQDAIKRSAVDFSILEGVRTIERQRELLAAGASRTMKSRHLTGHAVDLGAYVGGRIAWDWPLYNKIAEAMKAAARAKKVKITWGGDWRSFKDGPHFQLQWSAYPAEEA